MSRNRLLAWTFIFFASILPRDLAADDDDVADDGVADERAEGGGVLVRWEFTADHLDARQFKPADGTMPVTLSGGAVFDNEQPKALLLDGDKNRLTMKYQPDGAGLPTEAISAEAWVRLDSATRPVGIVGAIQDNGNAETGWLLGTRASQFCFAISSQGADDGDGRLTYLLSQSTYDPGAWYHVVATYDGKTQKIYVDGRLKNEDTTQSGPIKYPNQAFFNIGAYHDDDEDFRCPAAVRSVAIFARALSAEEVAARFTARSREFPDIHAVRPTAGWPVYMHDHARTGITPEQLAPPLALRWTYHARHAPQPAWPAPAKNDYWNKKSNLPARVIYDRAFHVVSDGRRVFFGSSADDSLRCLDIATGEPIWSFVTEGPVRLAPSIHDDRVYAGSDDGNAYCLKAEDGKLIWKYRAAPSSRRIPGNGRMISVWPVRTDLMVYDGQVRFTAGMFPSQGAYQFALDPVTGKEIASGNVPISPQGYLQRHGNQLVAASGRAPSQMMARFRRRQKGTGELLGGAPEGLRYALIRAGSVRYAGGEGRVAAIDGDGTELWQAEVEGTAYSLAVAGGRLLVSTDRGTIYCFAPKTDQPAGAPHVVQAPRKEFPWPDRAVADSYETLARQIIDQTGVSKGYCLVLGADRGRLVYQLARQTGLRIIGVEQDAERVAIARRDLARDGLYGQVSIVQGSSDELPFGDCLFNLIVSDRWATGEPVGRPVEVHRVLRPVGGVALLGQPDDVAIGERLTQESVSSWLSGTEKEVWKHVVAGGRWVKLSRGPLPGVGEWTHTYADPENTACSDDRQVQGKLALQWFGRPGPSMMLDRHHRTASPLVRDGRVFVPGNDHVFAVDAYNGTPLWDRSVPDFRRVGIMRDCGNMAAGDDIVYLAAGSKCLRLQPQTGAALPPLSLPSDSDDVDHTWAYLAVVDDFVVGSSAKPGAARRQQSREAILEGTYYDFRPIVTSDAVFAYHREDQKDQSLAWKYDSGPGAILNPTLTIGDGRVYFVQSDNPATRLKPSGRSALADLLGDGAHLVALQLDDGSVAWRRAVDFKAIQHHLFLCYAQGRLAAVGSRNEDSGRRDNRDRKIEHVAYDTHVFNAADGEPIWKHSQNNQTKANGDHGEQDHHPVIVDKTIYVEPYAYDLMTGEKRSSWKLARQGNGCGTISASASTFFFRANTPTMCDLATGRQAKVSTVSRPGCWINIIPAGGLVLIPEGSSGCTCNFPIQTSLAYIPQSSLDTNASRQVVAPDETE